MNGYGDTLHDFGFLVVLMISGCGKRKLETVERVDLEKYSGTWYEIASFPNRFQRGCTCTQATYIPEGRYVKVVNKCIRNRELSE